MGFNKILKDIKQRQIALVYLFSGEEPYLARQLVTAIEEAVLEGTVQDFNYDLFDGEKTGLATVMEAAYTLPVFAEKRLVIVKNAPWFTAQNKDIGEQTKEQQQMSSLLLDYLEQPVPTTCLVFMIPGKADKRRKVYKELVKKGIAWEGQLLEGQALGTFVQKWLGQRGKSISSRSLGAIISGHQGGLELLVRELEKLEIYVGDRDEITLEDIKAVIIFPEQNSIFELTDAVGTKDPSKALWLLRWMLQSGEAPIYILIMLARQLRLILQGMALLEEGYSQSQMAQKMQAHPYAVKKALTQARNHDKNALIIALEKILETDVAIKTGQGEPEALMEQTVLELCS